MLKPHYGYQSHDPAANQATVLKAEAIVLVTKAFLPQNTHITTQMVNGFAHKMNEQMLNTAIGALFNHSMSLNELKTEITIESIYGPQDAFESQAIPIPSLQQDAIAISLIGFHNPHCFTDIVFG